MNIEMWCRTSALKSYEARPAESIREEGEARAVNGEREGIVQHESAGRCYSTVIKVTAGRRRQLMPCTSALDLSRACQTHGHQGERNAMAVLSAMPLGMWQCAAMDVCASLQNRHRKRRRGGSCRQDALGAENTIRTLLVRGS